MGNKTEKDIFKGQAYDLQEEYRENHRGIVSHDFGLCSSCNDFNYVRYEFGKEKFGCGYDKYMMNWPTGNERIVECLNYVERGKLSLNEMANLATYINNDKKKIGF
jgi:hypothetical protein